MHHVMHYVMHHVMPHVLHYAMHHVMPHVMQAGLKPLFINIHKTPGSSRVGSGANPCAFVPQHYFASTGSTKEDFEKVRQSLCKYGSHW